MITVINTDKIETETIYGHNIIVYIDTFDHEEKLELKSILHSDGFMENVWENNLLLDNIITKKLLGYKGLYYKKDSSKIPFDFIVFKDILQENDDLRFLIIEEILLK